MIELSIVAWPKESGLPGGGSESGNVGAGWPVSSSAPFGSPGLLKSLPTEFIECSAGLHLLTTTLDDARHVVVDINGQMGIGLIAVAIGHRVSKYELEIVFELMRTWICRVSRERMRQRRVGVEIIIAELVDSQGEGNGNIRGRTRKRAAAETISEPTSGAHLPCDRRRYCQRRSLVTD